MRLLWISGIDGFCHRYEVLHRVEQARLLGAPSVVRHFEDARLLYDVARADLVIAYRCPETPLLHDVLRRARRDRVPVLGTIDDLIFVPEEASLPELGHLDAGARTQWLDGVRRYRAVLGACDGFIAPTEPLLEAGRALGWRSWLHRDALSAVELALGDAVARRRDQLAPARDPACVVLGYFSGTPTHDHDFAELVPALADVRRVRPGVRLRITGPLRLDPALQPFADRVERLQRVPWTALPKLIAGVDVNLAPLELGRRFALAKGEVKYLEAAAVAVPTIASPTPAFRHAIRDGENGRLAGDVDAWREALTELIDDAARRRMLGEAARRDVRARFAPEQRARELAVILDAATASARGASLGLARETPAFGSPRERASSTPPREPSTPVAPVIARGSSSHSRARVALEPDARPVLVLDPGDAVSPPLAPGSRLVQELVVDDGGLTRLDLATVTYGQRLAHRVRLTIHGADSRVVLRRMRDASLAADRAWWSFVVPPGRVRAGEHCRIEVETAGATASGVLSFGLAATREGATPPATLDGTSLGAPLALRAFAAWNVSAHRRPATRVLDHATTLNEALLACAAEEDGAKRLVFTRRGGDDERHSLRDLLDRATAIRAVLRAHGLRHGDAVLLILPTGVDLVAAYFAVLLAGGTPALAATPTQRVADPEAYRRLIGGLIADATPHLVCCDARAATVLDPAGGAVFAETPLLRIDTIARIVATHTPSSTPAHVGDEHRPAPDDVATIQYSSGSTGTPKGVRLTHRAMLNNLRAVRDALALDARDVSVNWIPLYHDMGLIDALLLPLLCGCETVLLPTGDFVREPALWLAALHRHRGTISWAPNFAYALCVERVRDDETRDLELSSWRLAINAAEPVLAETIAAFEARFAPHGFRAEAMTPAWGLAENVTIATADPLGERPRVEVIDRHAAAARGVARPVVRASGELDDAERLDGFACVAVGRSLPGCTIEIRDGTRVLGERAIGDVWLASDSLFTGYGPRSDATASARQDGWLATGDRGYLANGELYFVARTKDVIVIAGEKHAPHDVETAINRVPGVRAGCAIAFGVLDRTRGTEELCAVVETRLETPHERDALARAIRSRVTRTTGLALRHLKLVPPGGVGKTTSGKLARAATRAQHADGMA